MTWDPAKTPAQYLALDQSFTRVGFAIGSPSPEMVAPCAGVYVSPKRVGRKYGVVLLDFYRWLLVTIQINNIEQVCFESPFMPPNNTDTIHGYALSNKMIGVIELVCEHTNVKCSEVTPHVWRKHFLGVTVAPKIVPVGNKRRRWLKELAITACRDRGWAVETDDEADACGILDYMLACADPSYAARTGTPLFTQEARLNDQEIPEDV